MKIQSLALAAAAAAVLSVSSACAAQPAGSFGFNALSIKGAPSGEVRLTGGGTFDATAGINRTGGVDPGEPLKTVVTDDNTVVIRANFFLEANGGTKAFTGTIFISAEDEAPELEGVQNVWVQGVGCTDAMVQFR